MAITISVDIGNTRAKVGLFNGRTLLKTFFITKEADIKKEVSNLTIEEAIISSVSQKNKLLSSLKSISKKTTYVTSSIALPIKNLYVTPKTIGSDRIAAAVGATFLFPGKNALVVDTGSCITFDFINGDAEYIGGSISPGINMRLKAMQQYTSLLPLVEWKNEMFPEVIGNSTESCILSGAVNGAVAEIKGVIDYYRCHYSPLEIVVTGGDASFFEKALKNGIFADQNLVLKGLNEILQYKSENS